MEANCRMRTVVAKFGGTSLADAEHFQKIREIIRKDPDRRYIVVSAPGKRFEEDIKVTDLLLMCWEEAASGGDFEVYLSQVAQRFREILDGLGLAFPLDEEIDEIRTRLQTQTPSRPV